MMTRVSVFPVKVFRPLPNKNQATTTMATVAPTQETAWNYRDWERPACYIRVRTLLRYCANNVGDRVQRSHQALAYAGIPAPANNGQGEAALWMVGNNYIGVKEH